MPATPSRRALLRAVAGATAAAGPGKTAGPGDAARALPRVPEWDASRELTVLTRNLGLGAGLLDLLDDDTVDPEVVHEKFTSMRNSGVPERMDAIAAEIAAVEPAVVGLQEASLVRRGPRDGEADERVVDFLGELATALLGRSEAGYRRAATVTNADVTLPARSPDGERFTVRLTDRDALLVRDDVALGETEAGNYSVNASTVRDGQRFTATRGYCGADVVVDDVTVRVVSTHLSVVDVVRRAQAGELVATHADREGPTVLLGDFNARPEPGAGSAYATVAEEYTDSWAAVGGGDGATCCQLPELDNPNDRLGIRIDHVFCGGPAEPVSAERTGARADARVEVGGRSLWPSDHTGLAVRLRVAPAVSKPRAVVRALL
jgi:endonuclease/exonuclease/phosphatase family metal-dependent hydrolase